MGLNLLPSEILGRYHVEERRHACAIMAADFPGELKNIVDCMAQFELLRSEIEIGGGGKSRIARRFDGFLSRENWKERSVKVGRSIEGNTLDLETHKVDFCKGRIAIEVEWNNKDPFFSRDLNAFRLLHELNVISVGVIITRRDELQEIFNRLGREVGRKYGASTTHWSKLMPRVESGGAGNCPLLLIGIGKACYRDDVTADGRV